MQEWSLPSDPQEQLELAVIAVVSAFAMCYAIKHLLSGFLPPQRAKLPKPGKLTKIVSPHLQAFVAALPRPTGDVLASTCKPLGVEGVP